MPVKKCTEDGKPGYKCGDSGKCYVYSPGDEAGRKRAKRKAILQCRAMDEPVSESDYEEAFDKEWFNDILDKLTNETDPCSGG